MSRYVNALSCICFGAVAFFALNPTTPSRFLRDLSRLDWLLQSAPVVAGGFAAYVAVDRIVQAVRFNKD